MVLAAYGFLMPDFKASSDDNAGGMHLYLKPMLKLVGRIAHTPGISLIPVKSSPQDMYEDVSRASLMKSLAFQRCTENLG